MCTYLSSGYRIEPKENLILNKRWFLGPSIIHLKQWRPGINPQIESIFIQQIWVSVIELPIENLSRGISGNNE
jgi:hypothetical protein